MRDVVEFPRTVYGPDGQHMTIKTEDERPDGWSNEPGGYEAPVDMRAEYKAKLDQHNVDYAKNLPTHKLAALVAQLEDYLLGKDHSDDAA